MRTYPRFILIVLSLFCLAESGMAEDPVPVPSSARFPNIKASLDDGFFVLAEQQVLGILRSEPRESEEREAALLLAHALWGQKRYSEMLDRLARYNGEPGYTYWRARANFELKRYDTALSIMKGAKNLEGSPYAPSILRLQGYIEQLTDRLEGAEAAFRAFEKEFPLHREQIDNQFDLAEVLSRQKRFPEAISIYETLVEEKNDGVSQRARLRLAHVLYTQGAEENYDDARSLLSGLATNDQTRLAYRIDAFVDLAALEEQDGQRPAAMEALRQAAALSPDARQRVPLKLSLVRMLLRDGDIATALNLLEQCRAEAPNETLAADLQLEKAGALLQAKQYDAAAEAYQIYLDVADDADGLARAYFGKGLALWGVDPEHFAEAASAFDKAAKGLNQPMERADALFKAGDAYYRSDQFEDAEKRYRSFVMDYPEHENVPNALYQLGLSLVNTGRREDARETFKSLETDYASTPFAEKAALRLADVMKAEQEWTEALEKYEQIRQTYTNETVAVLSFHQRGLVLFRLGRFSEAQQAFETVVADYPESEHAPQASFLRGYCLAYQGQVEEAVETCQNFIQDYPDSQWIPEVLFWLAEQDYNQGKYSDAEPLFLRIVEEYPSRDLASRALYWAGRAAAAQANYVGAIERYSEVAKRYPESEILPHTRFAQGDALTELGEFARAILAFEEILKNYPESYLVNAAWGRKGDCQFSLAADSPGRYAEAMNSFQAILDRPSAPVALKLQAEYKVGRCLEKTNVYDKAFNRYMNVVYTFITENVERSPDSVLWFTRSAFGSAALKEREKAWAEAVQIYERVIEANVPSKDEAIKRIEKIKKDNWLLFQQAEEK